MKTCLLKENYRPVVTTEIRHGFLLVWMGDVGEEVRDGKAGEPDFHFEGEEAKKILRYFDRRSMDLMKAGYPVVSMAIPDEYIRIVEGKIMKKSQFKILIKEIVKNLQLEYNEPNKSSGQNMTPVQKMTVDLLKKRSFQFVKFVPGKEGIDVVLERPWGKGRHGGSRFARVTHDGTIGNDGMDVNKYLSVVGEMIANKDAIPEPMGFVNVEESGGDDKDLEEAKKLAAKIWGDKVGWVAHYPASSNTKYFRVDINGTAEWLTKTQTSGWLYSKNGKMVSVNDLSVNEIFTVGDVLKAGFGAKFPPGTKLGKKYTFFSDIPVGSIFVLGSGKYSDYYKKLNDKNFKNVKTGKIGSTYGHHENDFRASVVDPNFEKGHQEFKDKYTERTNPDGTYIDDMESGMKSQAYSGLKEGRWAMGEYTPIQQQVINVLQKKGFREVSSFPNQPDAEGEGQDNQVIVVLQKKTSGFGYSQVEVDPQGMCNGESIQDYMRNHLREQTSSGAAGGQAGGTISVPAWGTKNKEGSPRAIAATKRMKGWKVAKSISEKVK